MTVVRCDHIGCVHNRDGGCSLAVISIEMKFGEFCCGERPCYPTRQECKETEDGDD